MIEKLKIVLQFAVIGLCVLAIAAIAALSILADMGFRWSL